MKKKIIMIVLALTLVSMVYAGTEDITLIVDGVDITETATPRIKSNRTVVPIKFIGDALEADVIWDGDLRTVKVIKDEMEMTLWIGSRVVQINGNYYVSDVAPLIIENRTYVPLKIISNAFSVGVTWDGSTRTVGVHSDQNVAFESVYDLSFTNISSESKIKHQQDISLEGINLYEGDKIKAVLLDPETMKGFTVYEGPISSSFTYNPKVEDAGQKVLAVGVYKNNQFIAGTSSEVVIDVEPVVTVTGVENKTYGSNIIIGQTINFLPKYVSYEIQNVDTGEMLSITKRDPLDVYTWSGLEREDGNYTATVIAYDGNEKPYRSKAMPFSIKIDAFNYIGGIYDGQVVSGPLSLYAYNNQIVDKTVFYIKDEATGTEEVLGEIPYGNFDFDPTKTLEGKHALRVEVTTRDGQVITSPYKTITVDDTPFIKLVGVGPNQVLTSSAALTHQSNVTMEDVTYVVAFDNGTSRLLDADNNTFVPTTSEAGTTKVYVKGVYNGKTYKSETVTLTVYLGDLYGSKPIVPKDQFKALVSDLAVDAYADTGMVASLQVAQAILETGWGQKVPVDKYSGKFSYNLFGIKGSSSNGYVTSNTWEVYNGKSFRVDANFRAYQTVEESWADHKSLLLEKSRYQPFRDVMYDPTLGAYAIRRCGYATDPNYPMKLINIIDLYDLRILDEITL